MNQKMKILELVDRHKYLRQGMIQQELSMLQRTSQATLKNLVVKDKVLNRFRISRDQYIYHTEKRSEKWRHWLAINEFHFALQRALKQGQRCLYYQLEYRYATGQADGLYVIQLRENGGVLFFLEMDDGANQFDKVEKYERYYLGKQWVNEPWSDPMGKGVSVFPIVVVVTPRQKEIIKLAGKAEKVKWLVFSNCENAVKGVLQ